MATPAVRVPGMALAHIITGEEDLDVGEPRLEETRLTAAVTGLVSQRWN